MTDRRISARQFKASLEQSPGLTVYDHAGVVKHGPAVKSRTPDELAGELVRTWIASTGAVDRDGDTINQKGWKLKDFRKGGSILWAHGYEAAGTVPIAKPLKTTVEDDQLLITMEFTPADLNPFGHMMFRLADNGFVRGGSVGFLPIKFQAAKDEDRAGFMPMDFLEQSLLEFSLTPVPANPEALDTAKSLGIDLDPLRTWIESALDTDTEIVGVTRGDLEIAYRVARAASMTSLPKIDNENKTGSDIEPTEQEVNLMGLFDQERKAIEELQQKAVKAVDDAADSFVATLDDVQEVQKRGRTLSASNEAKLRAAKEKLDEVLSALDPADHDDGKNTQPEQKSEPQEPQSTKDNQEPKTEKISEERIEELIALAKEEAEAETKALRDQMNRILGRAD